MTPTRLRLGLRDQFRAALGTVAGDRYLRPDVVDGDHGPEMAWTVHERTVMLRLVNQLRAEMGRDPVGDREVWLADQRSAGRTDWFYQFALRCADLVLQD